MACNNLGLFATASDPDNSCGGSLSTSLYGSGLTIGYVVYLNSGCTGTTASTSYYSDGINVYNVISGTVTSISGCTCPQFFCVENDTNYDDTYQLAGNYIGQSYFTGQTTGYFMFYSTGETRWCLSQTLGGSCDQFGPFGSASDCPDFDDTVAYQGICVTTTTTVNPCATFDFTAIFDCLVPTTTTTTTAAPTTTTTTTVLPNPCSATSITVSAVTYTTTTTTIAPTTTTTTTINYPCNFSGEVIFNTFAEVIQCANSKRFSDCFNGVNYYTSDLVLISGNTPLENYVYFAEINGQQTCVIFDGLFENISGVDTVVLLNEIGSRVDGSCLTCLSNIQPTTTTTSTSSTTTTTTLPPCILTKWYVENNSPSIVKYNYYECEGIVSTDGLNGYTSAYVCSITIPTSSSPNFTATDSGTIC
jgi:hypothetical protein